MWKKYDVKKNIDSKFNFFKTKKETFYWYSTNCSPSKKFLVRETDSNQKQSYCLGGQPFSNTNNNIEYEKGNPKTQKIVKNFKGTCNIFGRKKTILFTKLSWRIFRII